MKSAKIIILFLLLSSTCLTANAEIVKDTLYTTKGDAVYITYSITQVGNTHTVQFYNTPNIKIGKTNSSKYKNADKVSIVFFDRTGNFNRRISILNMTPEAFSIPQNVQYTKSSKGYFDLSDSPTLTFYTPSTTNIVIPIYFAYRSHKNSYTLFGRSSLKIRLSTLSKNNTPSQEDLHSTTYQTISHSEEATDITNEKIMESISLANELIAEASELPFSESLIDEVNYLRQKKREITDYSLLKKIRNVLDKYDQKKQELEEQEQEKELAAQQEAERKAFLESEKIKEQQDSIAAAQQAEREKDKKRNLWMIIGGVFLAILGYVGNQILQHIRNKKNQKDIINAQESIAHRAEKEAEQYAKNALQDTTPKAKNVTMKEASKKISTNSATKVHNNTKFSI